MTKLADVFVQVRLDTSGLSTEATAAGRSSGNSFERAFSPNVTAKIGADTTAAKLKVDELKRQIATVGANQSVIRATVALDVTKANIEIAALRARVRELNQSRAAQIKINGDTSDIDADIVRVKAEIAALVKNRTETKARLSLDTAGANIELATLKARLAEYGRSEYTATASVDTHSAAAGFGALITAGVGMGSALVPILAGVTAGVGALGTSLFTAAGALGPFGLAVGGTISQMKTAETAIKGAETSLNTLTKGTPAYAAKLKELTALQKGFNSQFGPAADGLAAVKEGFASFQTLTASTTLGVMGKALQGVADILPKLAPVANAAGIAVGGLVDQLVKFSSGPTFQGVLDFLQRKGPAAITAFGESIGNIAVGFGGILHAFAPMQSGVLGGLKDLTGAFAQWGTNLKKSDGFQSFMDYVRQVGPDVVQFFKEAAVFVGHFVSALAPLGALTLKGITSFLHLLNSLPQGLMAGIAAGFVAVVVGVKAWAAAQAILDSALLASPLGLLTVGLAAVAVGMVVAYKRSATFRDTVDNAFASVKKAAGDMWAATKPVLADLVGAFGVVVQYVKAHWPDIEKAIAPVMRDIQAIIRLSLKIVQQSWTDTMKVVVAVVKVATDVIKAIWHRWGSDIASFLKTILGDVVTLVKDAFQVIRDVFKVALDILKGHWKAAWEDMKKFLRDAWGTMTDIVKAALDVIKGVIKAAWELIKSGTKTAWDAVSGVIGNAWSTIRSKVSDGVNNVKSVLSSAWGTIQSAARTSWNAIVGVIKAAWGKVKGIALAPVKFIVNSVMAPLAEKFNTISGFVGGPTIDPVPHFARGGVMPGYTPGRDVGFAALSGGEAIMRPEWTRAVGEKQIHEMNKAARDGGIQGVKDRLRHHDILDGPFKHFASGGIFRPAKGGTPGSVHDQWTGYPAVDLAIPTGSQVASIAAGRVSASYDIAGPLASDSYHGDGPYGSYGRVIKILHSGFESLYAHLERRGVAVGSGVSGGQLIGSSDNTGNSSGPHLHFGVKGRSPLDFMNASTNYSGTAPGSLGVPPGTKIGTPFGLHLPGFVTNPLGALKDLISGLVDNPLLNSPFGSILKGLPGKLIGSMVDKIKSAAGSLLSGGAATAGFSSTGLSATAAGFKKYINSQAAKLYGWSSQSEVSALDALIQGESGFNPNAQNPTSSAYGLFQFLDSTWAGVGGHKTSNPALQTQYGLKYIQQRYGGPVAAENFKLAHNYYDTGGILKSGQTATNKSGKPEAVLTNEQWAHIKALIARTFLGDKPTLNAASIGDQLARVAPTPQALKSTYTEALAKYRDQLEEARTARERLNNAEDHAKHLAKEMAANQRDLARAQRELDNIGAGKKHADDRQAAQKAIDKINESIKRQAGTERDINKLIRIRTRDLTDQSAQADKAKAAAQRAADAYAAAQQAAVDQAKAISGSISATGSIASSPFKSAAGIVGNLRNALAISKDWFKVVKDLIKGGFRGALLQEFIDGGPSFQAVALGKDLLASGDLDEIAKLQDQLTRVGNRAGAGIVSSTLRPPRSTSPQRLRLPGAADANPKTIDHLTIQFYGHYPTPEAMAQEVGAALQRKGLY